MTSRSLTTEERTVIVHLLDVPEPARVAAAERLIRDEALDQVSPELAVLIRIRAIIPIQNPTLEVPERKARRVCGRGFLP